MRKYPPLNLNQIKLLQIKIFFWSSSSSLSTSTSTSKCKYNCLYRHRCYHQYYHYHRHRLHHHRLFFDPILNILYLFVMLEQFRYSTYIMIVRVTRRDRHRQHKIEQHIDSKQERRQPSSGDQKRQQQQQQQQHHHRWKHHYRHWSFYCTFTLGRKSSLQILELNLPSHANKKLQQSCYQQIDRFDTAATIIQNTNPRPSTDYFDSNDAVHLFQRDPAGKCKSLPSAKATIIGCYQQGP